MKREVNLHLRQFKIDSRKLKYFYCTDLITDTEFKLVIDKSTFDFKEGDKKHMFLCLENLYELKGYTKHPVYIVPDEQRTKKFAMLLWDYTIDKYGKGQKISEYSGLDARIRENL